MRTLRPTLSIESHWLHWGQNSLIYNPPLFNCDCGSIKFPVGRWHLSVRPAKIDVLRSESCWDSSPSHATQPHPCNKISKNFLFNTAHYCRHTNLLQRGPVYSLINFYIAEPSPIPSFCHLQFILSRVLIWRNLH